MPKFLDYDVDIYHGGVYNEDTKYPMRVYRI